MLSNDCAVSGSDLWENTEFPICSTVQTYVTAAYRRDHGAAPLRVSGVVGMVQTVQLGHSCSLERTVSRPWRNDP